MNAQQELMQATDELELSMERHIELLNKRVDRLTNQITQPDPSEFIPTTWDDGITFDNYRGA